jgi:hypothetical protein
MSISSSSFLGSVSFPKGEDSNMELELHNITLGKGNIGGMTVLQEDCDQTLSIL